MNPAVVNFGKGGWYPNGQKRLVDSLSAVGYSGAKYLWTDETQVGAPSHTQSPYAFKTSAFLRASEAGHDVVLWCDSSVWAIRSLDPIIEHIKTYGHVLFSGGWNCAQWSTDISLESFGITRDEAEKMPMFMACCMGLDLSTDRAKRFLDLWHAKAMDGVTFRGPWNNDSKECSQDSRCLGHRHDQTAGSIIAAQLGMDQILGHETHFAYYYDDMSKINPSVQLLAQGM